MDMAGGGALEQLQVMPEGVPWPRRADVIGRQIILGRSHMHLRASRGLLTGGLALPPRDGEWSGCFMPLGAGNLWASLTSADELTPGWGVPVLAQRARGLLMTIQRRWSRPS